MSAATVAAACRAVLLAARPGDKVRLARRAARDWRLGRLAHAFDLPMPAAPARPERPVLLPPGRMPRRKRAGSDRTRLALVHALAHIEFAAIDLAFDLIGRFGAAMPRGFVDDWMRVGAEEAMHFALLDRRLRGMGAAYGDLPAHDGLWQSAADTSDDLLARLAIVPMVLEARGLDVTPATLARIEAAGDEATARILRRILADEVVHVAAGTRWFAWLCAARRVEPAATWQILVRTRFRGTLKEPFNDSARAAAGLTRDFYAALAVGDPSRNNGATPGAGRAIHQR